MFDRSSGKPVSIEVGMIIEAEKELWQVVFTPSYAPYLVARNLKTEEQRKIDKEYGVRILDPSDIVKRRQNGRL